ncbi:MAG: gamma-glutamyltransferase [Candidatus Heimdallarchaeota archaeon]|nr:gamma-glutamyltransferase [Candidatus Heimdallarchaeota archaeon]
MEFSSRRSPVHGRRGIVATSQPLAAEAGMRMLQKGGNAADAAVATAAALNVTEPTSTGIGGDCFALFYDSKTKNVSGVNGSGRAPKDLTLDLLAEQGFTESLPRFHPHTVTVPGAAAGWIDTLSKHGTMDIKTVLQPAIELARDGFPVSLITARAWDRGRVQLNNGPNASEMLIGDRAPKFGEMMKLPNLANTFEMLAEHGKPGFYEGTIAKNIVELLGSMGGVMSLDDLKSHQSTFDTPISVNYHGVDVFEIPPNGQGITALLALNILEEFDLASMNPLSTDYYHIFIEALRIAFADSRWFVSDPEFSNIPIEGLLSKDYATERRQIINPKRATIDTKHGSPVSSSGTVYLSVVDGDGNACSFINSNYMGFGTGLIPKGGGFTLQNRGHNFSLEKGHPNALSPGKRPYHTIIPAMATKEGELYASFGVMGGFMQPQGHALVLSHLVDQKMDPQMALDHPRFCITDGSSGGKVALEEGIPVHVMSQLASMGHDVVPTAGMARMIFGRGQIIMRDAESGALTAGSDPRADGQAIAW